MTHTKSGTNSSIQSNGIGPGHSSHKSKIQEHQPRGEARMEDSRTSTGSQSLAITFDTLIESLEADITAISITVKRIENTASKLGKLNWAPYSSFQEQWENHEKERLELKEDIKSSINDISLTNDLPRQSTPILERYVLSLNNYSHHTVSSNSELETACNFKETPRLEEWPTFSGEGEYNHMEFMKTIYMLKEDFNIPDEYISARLHSLFTKSAKKWY
ncbi:hypothetical protein O181_111813 [Austropuccinia psidii MF-1]|uniref:Uncharacterized protein n=1 Tax=Austropuccinia psidii MF-1 TaxID=1389203 RepID=A0A9Q3K078_9BASI|nr:hypothetical protein [Austropuccinia psidii MF-1]